MIRRLEEIEKRDAPGNDTSIEKNPL